MKQTHESRHYTTSIRARTMAGSEGTEFGKETWEKWTNVVKAGRGKPWGTKGKGLGRPSTQRVDPPLVSLAWEITL